MIGYQTFLLRKQEFPGKKSLHSPVQAAHEDTKTWATLKVAQAATK